MFLRVDEGAQGYLKEFHDIEELKKAVVKLCDENVEEICIKKTGNNNDNPGLCENIRAKEKLRRILNTNFLDDGTEIKLNYEK